MITFTYESSFPVSVEELFAWHENPDALRKLIPPDEPVAIIKKDPSLKPGAQAHIRIGIGPFSIDWIVEHVDYKKNAYFEDRQVRGPFKSWTHRHVFVSEGEKQSKLIDEVRFSLPFSLITHPLLKTPLLRKLRSSFAKRHETLRKELDQSS